MKINHVIVYRGIMVSLAVMLREYIPLLFPGINDLSVTRGIIMRPPITLEAEYEWYEKLKDSKNQDVFAILLHEPKGSYRYIGQMGLHQIGCPNGCATTGSVIIDAGTHGKGYGTEAKLLLLYHAFYTRGLRKVSSGVKAFNGNSFGHLVKCGYKIIGRRRNHHFDQGTFVDEILLEIFQADFYSIWTKYKETGELPRLTAEQRIMMKNEMAR
jgi:RimJ/RimL family protein N-acetyltransferase